jgi:hypothetical protein
MVQICPGMSGITFAKGVCYIYVIIGAMWMVGGEFPPIEFHTGIIPGCTSQCQCTTTG